MSAPTPPSQPTGYGALPPSPSFQQPGTGTPPPPRRGGNPWPLVIGLGSLTLALVVAAIVVAGVLVMRSDSNRRESAATGASPTAMSTTEPAEPASASPSVSQSEAMSDDKLTAADFQGDWDFQLGDVLLDADYVSSRDYPTCGPVASPTLEHLGCRYAAIWVHEARAGRLRMARIGYVFHSAKEAQAAAKKAKETDFQLPIDAEIKNFADGKWIAKAFDKVMFVTFVTTEKGIPAKDLESYVHYGEADLGAAVGFMTIS